jgi:putative endonuclease
MKEYFAYIMASRSGVLYTGITNDLKRRVSEHKAGKVPGFTSKYRVTQLVYFERYTDVREAIAREKEIKGWRRAKKIALLETLNPEWRDLSLSDTRDDEGAVR